MPIRNSLALAALATSLFTMPALGQPAHLPSTPVEQRAAWRVPEQSPPPTAVAGPSVAQVGQQEAFLGGFVTLQLLAQQQAALQSQQQAEAEPAALEGEELEPSAPQAISPAVEPVAPARAITSSPPSALDARGADGASQLSWRLPDGGRAARYRVYFDDGTLAAASVQRTVLASDECPSQVAFVAGSQPESGWTFAEVDGAATGAQLGGLDNGQPYAFAVAAVDDAGVVGPLSDVSCAIPSAHGEYELDAPTAATAASLTGAEGGCSFSGRSSQDSLAPVLMLAGAAAFGLALRRRRPGSPKRVLEG